MRLIIYFVKRGTAYVFSKHGMHTLLPFFSRLRDSMNLSPHTAHRIELRIFASSGGGSAPGTSNLVVSDQPHEIEIESTIVFRNVEGFTRVETAKAVRLVTAFDLFQDMRRLTTRRLSTGNLLDKECSNR